MGQRRSDHGEVFVYFMLITRGLSGVLKGGLLRLTLIFYSGNIIVCYQLVLNIGALCYQLLVYPGWKDVRKIPTIVRRHKVPGIYAFYVKRLQSTCIIFHLAMLLAVTPPK